jgi:hypothetical protein
MGKISTRTCPGCGFLVDETTTTCPRCNHSFTSPPKRNRKPYWGFEYRSEAELFGWPIIHVAVGRHAETGKLLVAKGVIAIGQFGIGLITIAQFGIGLLFCLGQFGAGLYAVGQLALGGVFGLGQCACGITAIGQFAIGRYVLAQIGFGEHVWTTRVKDPVAVEYFTNLWGTITDIFGR